MRYAVHVHIAVTMASRRKMTDCEIENFIQLWRYDMDTSMEMMQFYVGT